MKIEIIEPAELPLVRTFYKKLRDKTKLNPRDAVFVVREEGIIVAALRFVALSLHEQGCESDAVIMRSVLVDPARRGQGLARRLIQQACEQLDAERCYCFPYRHLEALYLQCGFTHCQFEQVPESLRRNWKRYQHQADSDRSGQHQPVWLMQCQLGLNAV
jgi:predicted N-acetyltransferase YhbS